MTQPWPQLCLFGHQGPDGAEADDGTWSDKVRRCKCTRCGLIRLNLDQCKENGRLTGVMCRVKDLERENDCLKKEHTEMKLRLVGLECTCLELQRLALNSKNSEACQTVRQVPIMTLKRKSGMEFANHVPLMKGDPATSGGPEASSTRLHAVQDPQHDLDGVTGVPGVPGVPA